MKTRQLSFESRESGSYERARSNGHVIVPRGKYRYEVRLTDSDGRHECFLARDRRSHAGYCDCLGYQFSSGPCSHLWAIKIAEERAAVEIHDASEALADGPICPLCDQPVDPTDA